MALMADQPIRAVALHGAGGLFSAGADLETMARFDAQAAMAFIEALHGTCQRILLAPKPIIATKAPIAYSMQFCPGLCPGTQERGTAIHHSLLEQEQACLFRGKTTSALKLFAWMSSALT